MLAGDRLIFLSDSTTFVGYDVGDDEPDDNVSYLSIIKSSANVRIHDLSAPAARADYHLINQSFCGLRPNASSIHNFIRGITITNVVNTLLGTNDWAENVGVTNYINGMTAIVKNQVAVGFDQISVSTPFIRYYSDDEPTNSLGETLSEYSLALGPMVTSLQSQYPSADIRLINTQGWLSNNASNFDLSGAHLRPVAHAVVAPLFLAAWRGFGWLR